MPRFLGEDDTKEDERDWKECRNGKIGCADELDIAVDTTGIVRACKALHSAGNERCEHHHDRGVVEIEDERKPCRPGPVRMRCSEDSLGEDKVDDEQEEDAC